METTSQIKIHGMFYDTMNMMFVVFILVARPKVIPYRREFFEESRKNQLAFLDCHWGYFCCLYRND